MGAIEEVYADLETDVSEAKFREAVEAKVEQMGGLADEETAAMLVAHELQDGEVNAIADIEPGMEEVKFLAKAVSVGELRTFEREEADADGRVINVEVADETGTVRLAFWDEEAAAVDDGQIEAGDVLRIQGRPKEGYNGLEVSVDRAEAEPDATIEVDLGETGTIESLTMGQSDVTVRGVALDTDSIRTFERDDGSEGRVANFTLGDETGRVRVTLWDERADRAGELEPGDAVEVVDGYVREREGSLELHVGEGGAVDEVTEEVEFQPEATPIEAVEMDDQVDIAGVVRSTDPKRTFDRDDGSEGQVRNVRVQDATGDIRVALWGEKADREIQPGDEVLVADVEIQDGWQDDLEASAGWQASVVVLDETNASLDVAATDDGGVDTADTGLDAFSGNGADAGGASDGGGADTNGASDGDDGATGGGTAAGGKSAGGGGSEAVQAQAGEGETVEFTGTVVQTGEPVVLDDGTETMSVETEADVMLGQEVTARGTLREGRLDADDVL